MEETKMMFKMNEKHVAEDEDLDSKAQNGAWRLKIRLLLYTTYSMYLY
jgi:hypothetical protein